MWAISGNASACSNNGVHETPIHTTFFSERERTVKGLPRCHPRKWYTYRECIESSKSLVAIESELLSTWSMSTCHSRQCFKNLTLIPTEGNNCLISSWDTYLRAVVSICSPETENCTVWEEQYSPEYPRNWAHKQPGRKTEHEACNIIWTKIKIKLLTCYTHSAQYYSNFSYVCFTELKTTKKCTYTIYKNKLLVYTFMFWKQI